MLNCFYSTQKHQNKDSQNIYFSTSELQKCLIVLNILSTEKK